MVKAAKKSARPTKRYAEGGLVQKVKEAFSTPKVKATPNSMTPVGQKISPAIPENRSPAKNPFKSGQSSGVRG